MLIYKQWNSNGFNTDLLDISLQIINVPWCDTLSENDRALLEICHHMTGNSYKIFEFIIKRYKNILDIKSKIIFTWTWMITIAICFLKYSPMQP